MMKNKNKKIYILFVLVFILLLIFANNIILMFIDTDSKYVATDLDKYDSNSKVYTAVGSLETYEDMQESLYINGWAFCETENDNPDKKITVILSNNKKSYALETSAVERRDVRSAFPDKKIPSMINGIETKGSTLGVSDGIYDIYLYVWENEDNYGIIKTGKQIIKSKDEFKEITSYETNDSLSFEYDENLKHSENISYADGLLNIDGWAFIDGLNADNQDVYVYLLYKDNNYKLFTCSESTRMDVSNLYDNDNYFYSGFSASIPVDDTDKPVGYAICIDNNGTMKCSDIINIK